MFVLQCGVETKGVQGLRVFWLVEEGSKQNVCESYCYTSRFTWNWVLRSISEDFASTEGRGSLAISAIYYHNRGMALLLKSLY